MSQLSSESSPRRPSLGAQRRKSSSTHNAQGIRSAGSPYPPPVPSTSNSTNVSPTHSHPHVVFPSSASSNGGGASMSTGSQWIADYVHSRASSISATSATSQSTRSDVSPSDVDENGASPVKPHRRSSHRTASSLLHRTQSLSRNTGLAHAHLRHPSQLQNDATYHIMGGSSNSPVVGQPQLHPSASQNVAALGTAFSYVSQQQTYVPLQQQSMQPFGASPGMTFPLVAAPSPQQHVLSNGMQTAAMYQTSPSHSVQFSPSSASDMYYSPAQHQQMQAHLMQQQQQQQTSPGRSLDPSLAMYAASIRTAGQITASTTEKAKINFVHAWLNQSFSMHPEGNVSRQALYGLYIHICSQYNVQPINAASYGKAVRSCWPGIKTRRLGVRGASRYHYCGIRAANSIIEDLVAWINTTDLGAPNGPMTSPVGSGPPIAGLPVPSFVLMQANPSGVLPMNAMMPQQQQLGGPVMNISGNGMMGIPLTQGPNGLGRNHTPSTSGSSTSSLGMDMRNGMGRITLLPPGAAGSTTSLSTNTSSPIYENGVQYQHVGHVKTESRTNSPVDDNEDYRRSKPRTRRTRANHGMDTDEDDEHAYDDDEDIDGDNDDGEASPCSASPQSSHHQSPPFIPDYQISPAGGPFAQPRAPPGESEASNLRRQVSAPSLAGASSNPDLHAAAAPGSNLSIAELDIAMSELKTPTAMHFLQNTSPSSANHAVAHTTSFSPDAGPLVISGDMCRISSEAGVRSQLNDGASPRSKLLRRVRLSSPSAASAIDDGDPTMVQRRATFPELSIIVPPNDNGPASSRSSTTAPVPARRSERLTTQATKSADAEASLAEQQLFASLPAQLRVRLPNFDEVLSSASSVAQGKGPAPVSPAALDKAQCELIWNTYRTEHCLSILKLVSTGRWEEIEAASMLFWTQLDDSQRALVHQPILAGAMYRADAAIYDAILEYLAAQISALQQQPMPAYLHGNITKVAMRLEESVISAVGAFDEDFVSCRVELASRMGHLMQRYLGMVQLAQALNEILSQPYQSRDLLSAWSNVDFEMVVNHAALVTNCAQDNIMLYLDEFKQALRNIGSEPLSAVITFAEHALHRSQASAPASASREFLLKWNFITSQVLRDFTINSNPAFGAFQILSLFVEEWIGFKILKATVLYVQAVTASVTNNAQQAVIAVQDSTAVSAAGDTSAFLISPNPATNNAFEPIARPMTAPPGNAPNPPLTAVPGSNFNFAGALSPTTRAIFGEAKTPIYLNFGALPPLTPSLRSFHAWGVGSANNAYSSSFDDISVPALHSPARLSSGHPVAATKC